MNKVTIVLEPEVDDIDGKTYYNVTVNGRGESGFTFGESVDEALANAAEVVALVTGDHLTRLGGITLLDG